MASINVLTYCGNKYNESKKLRSDNFLELLNNYNNIIEPFGGSFGFTRYFLNEFKTKKIIINDLDKNLIDIYNFLIYSENEIIDAKMDEFKEILENIKNSTDPNQAYYIYCKNKNSDFFVNLFGRTIYHYQPFTYSTNVMTKRKICYDTKFKKLKQFKNNFKNIDITFTNLDYKNSIENYKNDTSTLIYLDPPYLCTDNTNYDHNICEKFYDYWINNIMHYNATFILVINNHPLHNYFFKHNGYILKTYDKRYNVSKKLTSHIVISNKDLNI